MRPFVLLAFSALMLLEAYMFTDETDKQALFEFKSQVSQGKRVVLSSWNNSFPLCNWTGVTCGRKHKRVTGLDLRGLKLGGVISPFIGNLSFLRSLNLSDNLFGGTIPQEVGKLFRLQRLFMNFNFLEGGIPATLFNCSRLYELHLFSNSLGQEIPSELGSLTKLVIFDLGRNGLNGKLPASLGNLTSLIGIGVPENNIEGGIPNEIARLTQMVYLEISENRFSGVFPSEIYNLSSLQYLNIFSNNFSGSLRPAFGNFLPSLRMLYVGTNSFTGHIPITLSNISNLQNLGMSVNSFTGSIPLSFGNLRSLKVLKLHDNSFGSFSLGDLNFLGALTNCTQLETLDVANNVLASDLPTSIANLSINLNKLDLGMNLISGSIPHDIGNLISLRGFWLDGNRLTGPLPTSLGKLSGLVVFSVQSNMMTGQIPFSIGNISGIEKLFLSNNSFEGIIPPSLRKCSHLLNLSVGLNKLSGSVPREIMQISPLVFLSMSNNLLSGSLPKDIGRLENLGILSVAQNKLSGKLPETLGKCLRLEKIYLQGNSFGGIIPDISRLVGIKVVDFSKNNLSGSIPEYLTNFNGLEYLNLSFNNLEGKVPTQGKFKNVTVFSLLGNKNLCGGVSELHLKPCFSKAPPMGAKHFSLLKKVVIGVSIGISLMVLLFIALVSLRSFKKRKKNKTNKQTPSTLGPFYEMISYGDLRNATDGFSSSNLIGSGSFGTVFKALLHPVNKVVAVKVLNLQTRGAMKSFMAECESLKDVRHRNLVKILTVCSSIDFQGNEFKAIIYEFMPNGSLDMWLHPGEVEENRRPSRTLTLLERLKVAIDVASVLEYLHFHCSEAIAHCDIKPSNILLDDNLTAHVSDFGLARILLKFDQESFLNQLSSAGVRGTIGYVAPEYGTGGKISTNGDVYSFGILLLEMFSRKRPTNEIFWGDLTLHNYIKSALPKQVLDVADKLILQNGLRVGFPIAECLTLVLEVGLKCCEKSPTTRMAMNEVVIELISIRERFFASRMTARR